MQLSATIKDKIETPPDIVGPHGQAWLCDLGAARVVQGACAGDDATLAMWVVEATWAHPLWHSYLITLIHLRPMPDGRPTHFYLDGATHEMHVAALDPDGDRRSILAGAQAGRTWKVLTPMNFAAQFVARGDKGADEQIRYAVRRICQGTLSPDTDHIRTWISLFGSNMVKGETTLRTGSLSA